MSRNGSGATPSSPPHGQGARPAGTDQMAANQIEGHGEAQTWQSAFVLGPNVRFTRTPDRVAAPRNQPETIEPMQVARTAAPLTPPALSGTAQTNPQRSAAPVQPSQPRSPAATGNPAYSAQPSAPVANRHAQVPAAPQKPQDRTPASVVLPQPPDAVGARALTYKLRRELARQQAEQSAWQASMAEDPARPFAPQPPASQPAPLVQGMRSVLASTQSATVGSVQPTVHPALPQGGSPAVAQPQVGQSAMQQPLPASPAATPAAGTIRPAGARNAFFRPAVSATQSGQPPVQQAPVQQAPAPQAPAQTTPTYGPYMTVGRPVGAVLAATSGQTFAPAVSQTTSTVHSTAIPDAVPAPSATADTRLPISALLSDHIFFEAMFEPVAEALAPTPVQAPVTMPAPTAQQANFARRVAPTPVPKVEVRKVEVVRYAPQVDSVDVTLPAALSTIRPAFDAPEGSVVALYREIARRDVVGQSLMASMPAVQLPAAVIAPVVAAAHSPIASITSARQPLFKAQVALGEGEYELPPIDLLQEPPIRTTTTMTAEALEQSAGLLESVLEDFGVKGEVIDVRPGPVVTLYEFEPAPGVKSSRVIGISDDIARSMSALSARVAVVPGRNVIGIELPNPVRETVYLRELIETPEYSESRYKLPVCLGKTIGGESVIAELAKMPHLLVAGTTGSGKSVAINTMILSLLYRFRPDECRLIMVDPKMLELSVYDGIPHLLTPVVTDPKKAVMALKWAVREMEDRYRKMSRLSVRNIDGYNARAAQAREKGETITVSVQTGFDRQSGEIVYEEQELDLSPMPYIVVVVDEMADLMMVAGKEIEGAIQRLAQMARAAGIHLIMATQRPSVDVITGTIKANFPTRVSFQVTSKIDSRTILGEPGAEHLLGQGDMLHMVGGGRIARVHGPFVSDEEVEKVVAHLKLQGRPEYLGTVTEDADEVEEEPEEDTAVFDKGAMAEEDGNDLFDKAVKVVLRDKKCSTSYIQRRLSIGYNKAASLVERMEQEGIVGPANHVGKRAIIIGGREVAPVAEDFEG
ncbi:DNA translocase FtsK [Rhizobium sp. AAP43]|uniref:DNA translocase FtsK n=1 Tax=Rhizobium sp. AAP43 TaxID=1523420 RepID=UPI000AA24585|nr:DNA translocase FtsK [Rhizobium sp. AAP43]